MALLYPDRGLRGLRRSLTAACALLCLLPALGAADKHETITWKGDNPNANFNVGTLSLDKPELRQGSTLLRASRAEASGLVDAKPDNSIWKFTGAVHLEFKDVVLDAPVATVVFVGGHVTSVEVPAPQIQASQQAKLPIHIEFNGALLDALTGAVAFADDRMTTVQVQGTPGSPAQFSHQLKNSTHRVHGHADRIDYDAGKSLMRISGDAWFDEGNTEFGIPALTYNLDDGSYHGEGSSRGTFTPDEKVPAPRTPDRASAK